MSQVRGVDPTDWANRRKAAMERAKQIRDERKNALSEGDTFTPQVNARRPSQSNIKATDSLDKLAYQVRPDDPMEQPLAAQRSKPQQYEEMSLSPNSDALGKEAKKFGGLPRSVSQAQADAQYKSQFLRQHEDKRLAQQQAQASQAAAFASQHTSDPDPHDAFASMLRGGDDRGVGPGWNDDTTSNGFVARKPALNKKPRPSAYRSASADSDTPSGTAGNQSEEATATTTPRTTAMMYRARSKLSLLKSKMRQSESAGATRPPAPEPPAFSSNNPYAYDGEGRRTAPNEHFPAHGSNGHHSHGSSNNNNNNNNSNHQQGYGGGAGAVRKAGGGRAAQLEHEQQENTQNAPPPRRRAAAPPSNNNRNITEDDEYGQGHGYQPSQPSQHKPSRHPPQPQPQPVETYATATPPRPSAYPTEFPAEDDDAVDASQPQHECPDCGRKFNPIPYAKHIKICAKVFQKKRKVFDSSKMRVQDNPELVKMLQQAKKEEMRQQKKAQALGNANSNAANNAGNNAGKPGKYVDSSSASAVMPKQSAPVSSSVPKVLAEQPVGAGGEPKWKAQSNAFREAMQAMREYNKAKAKGEPLPPPVVTAPDPSLIPCPHCSRRFNAKAAERHIPQCVNIRAKPSTLRKGAGVAASSGVKKGLGGK